MKREYYFDYLRAAATFAVILWHSTSPVYYKFGQLHDWIPASLLFGIGVRWSVPAFFMISGALLLDRIEPVSVFYKKRLLRICIPLVAWTIIYGMVRLYYFKIYTYNNQPAPSFFSFVLIDQFKALFTDSLSYHLYFISIILGLYLITPYLARMLKGLSRRELEAFLGIGVAVYSLRLFYPNGIVLDHYEVGSNLLYFLLGFYLHKYPPGGKFRLLIYASGVISAAAMSWLNYKVEYLQTGHQDRWYLTSGCFVYMISIAVFVLFRQLAGNKGDIAPKGPLRKLLIFISSCSYGLYIAHPLAIGFLLNLSGRFTFTPEKAVVTTQTYRIMFNMNEAWGSVVQVLLVLSMLLVIFYVAKKVRLWRYLT